MKKNIWALALALCLCIPMFASCQSGDIKNEGESVVGSSDVQDTAQSTENDVESEEKNENTQTGNESETTDATGQDSSSESESVNGAEPEPKPEPEPEEVDQGKKGEIVTKGAETDANINVPGKITDNYTLPY